MTNPQPLVLWAEDNARDRMLIRDALDRTDTPAKVTLVADGVMLLEELEKSSPALIVLDLKMPRLGGVDVLRRMRGDSAWKDLPVIIFSSGNRPDEIAHCQKLGVREVLQKPVDFDVFALAVQRAVASVRFDPAAPVHSEART